MITTEDTEDTEVRDKELTSAIIGAAMTVHRELGPGLLESAYEKCIAQELVESGLPFEVQKPIPIVYKGLRLESGFRADMIVENRVLVELKAVEMLLPLHTAQVLTYLKLTGLHTALLINFNVSLLKYGVKRISL